MFTRATIGANFVNVNFTGLTDGREMFSSGDYDSYGPVINGDLAGLDTS
jgi:hypothetical protein